MGGTVYNIPLGGGLFKGPWAIGGEYCGSNRWNQRREVISNLGFLLQLN